MRALCVTLALVTLATSQAQARTSHVSFFKPTHVRQWFAPAPKVQVYTVKYFVRYVDGLKERVPYIVPKMKCYTATLCVPVLKKAQ